MTVTADARVAARVARLAAAGPDEMGRELAEGPAAVDRTLAEAERLAGDLATWRAAARRVILVGTGASLAMARTAEPILRTAPLVAVPGRLDAGGRTGSPGPVAVREASHAALGAPDGESFAAEDLVVAISQSGESPETLAAARLARAAGARVLAVTAAGASALASAADLVLHTPTGPEKGRHEVRARGAGSTPRPGRRAALRARSGHTFARRWTRSSPPDAPSRRLAVGRADRA